MAKEINLRDLYSVIKKRIWIIIIITVIATLAGYYIGELTPKSIHYKSSARVIIRAPLHANSPDMNTLIVMVTDPLVLGHVIDELHLNKTMDSLAKEITVKDVNNSAVLNISVIDSNQGLAVKISNSLAKVFKDQMEKVLGFNGVQLLSEPKSAVPIVTQPKSRIILGLISGLVLGIGLAFFIDSLDESMNTEHEVETLLGIPVLGNVSKMNKKNIKRKQLAPIKIKVGSESIGSK